MIEEIKKSCLSWLFMFGNLIYRVVLKIGSLIYRVGELREK